MYGYTIVGRIKVSFIGLFFKEMNSGRNSKITLDELNSYVLFEL